MVNYIKSKLNTPKRIFLTDTIPIKFLLSSTLESFINFSTLPQGLLFTGYFLLLSIPDSQMAILFSLLGLCQVLQIFSTVIYHYIDNKKRIILTFRLLRTFSVFITVFIPILLPKSMYLSALILLIITRYSIFNLIGGGFTEWNDYYVNSEIKGKYYGLRNVLFNAQSIVTSFILGILMDRYSTNYILYLSIFSALLVIAYIDWINLKKIDFPIKPKASDIKLTQQIVLPFKDVRYRKFFIFSFIWIMGLNMGRPLLNVYIIKYLNYSYSTVALANGLSAFFRLFAGIGFGIMIDRLGTRFVTRLCGIGFTFITFMYIFIVPNKPLIFTLLAIISGIFIIGFNVSNFNLNMKLSDTLHMNAYLSMTTAVMGISAFISINFSGLIIKLLNNAYISFGPYSLNSFQLLFLISGFLHLIAVYYFISNFYTREAKE